MRDLDGVIYVATDFEVLSLGSKGLERIALSGKEQFGTALRLLTAIGGSEGPGNALFSLGTKDLWVLAKGRWRRVVEPSAH